MDIIGRNSVNWGQVGQGGGGDLDAFPAATAECPRKCTMLLRKAVLFPSLQVAFVLAFGVITLALWFRL